MLRLGFLRAPEGVTGVQEAPALPSALGIGWRSRAWRGALGRDGVF